jgi:hypothetical protein
MDKKNIWNALEVHLIQMCQQDHVRRVPLPAAFCVLKTVVKVVLQAALSMIHFSQDVSLTGRIRYTFYLFTYLVPNANHCYSLMYFTTLV